MRKLVCFLALILFSGTVFADNLLDLTTAGSTVTVNGAVFQQMSQQPTGTGVVDPFLRLQANGTESGYNTDQSPHPPLDDKAGIWTHSLQLGDIGTVTRDFGLGGGLQTYYAFGLDINESDSSSKHLLSLDSLQLYTGTTTSPACCAPGGDFGSPLWDLDAGQNNYLLLDYSLNSGSGSGDMYAYIPVSVFAGNTNRQLYLYSKFGVNQSSDAGFEEWWSLDSQSPRQVPEPGSLLLMSAGLAFCGRATRRKRG